MLIISLSKISKAFLHNIKDKTGIDIYSPTSKIEGSFSSYQQLTRCYKTVFLGCKPQHIEDVAENLPRNIYNVDTVFISVLAGTGIKKVQRLFNIRKVCRVMPSLSFEFGRSFVACYQENLSMGEVSHITEMLSPNKVIWCKSEQQINEFTAIYGSGIGFVFEVMQSFLESSQDLLPEANKQELILNLFENATLFLSKRGMSFKQATDSIASKGGTTEAGLNALRENERLQKAIRSAFLAVLSRAEELAK